MPIWKQTPDIPAINARMPGTLGHALGIEVTAVGDDWLCGRMPVDARTRQPFGLLHGGASVALAETLASIAAWWCIPAGEGAAVGLEINANHLRGLREGVVTGTARPLHIGSTTQVWEVRIEDERQRLVCVSRCTLAVVRERG
jgi:1,4-dihydroxy-2-naphthoyl-CoA hydrolase